MHEEDPDLEDVNGWEAGSDKNEHVATMSGRGFFASNRRMSMQRRIRTWGIPVLMLIIGFGLGYSVHSPTGEAVLSNVPLLGDGLNATPDPSANMTDFWKVWNILNTQYVITHASSTMPTTQDKVWGAIEGLTASYGDPYTVFFPPTQAKEFQDDISGSFGGIGLEMDQDANGNLVVIAPLKGTPAATAGFEPKDIIAAINGTSTEGMTSDQAVNLIRGPVGSKVSLTIVRAGKPQTISVTRETIQVPEIDYSLDKSTGVYRISLYEFTTNSADLFNQAFAAFKASGSKLLIIDLRDNPGGYLDSAVSIASHFLPKGDTIVTEDYKGHQPNDVLTSTGTDDLPAGTKIVVLMNQGSASASEITAGALKDNHVATIIGTRSFGKGSVQQLIDIDGGSLKVTVARWLTPAGVSIMGNGITPDIDVESSTSPATVLNPSTTPQSDPQLQRAIQFLTTGK